MFSLIEHLQAIAETVMKKVYDKRTLKLRAITAEFLVFLLCGFISSEILSERQFTLLALSFEERLLFSPC